MVTELHFYLHRSEAQEIFIFLPATGETNQLTQPYAQDIANAWVDAIKGYAPMTVLSPGLVATLLEDAVKKTMGAGFHAKVEICAHCCVDDGTAAACSHGAN